ncbi:uncharacterized protein LOC121937181 [Sceloporus undulatus]|uniref:uncharacterized protein LOC121937181 n=1 Tax=Sceloporus undulatus TaxID=8520 RepID=UPI001C4D4E53|nr:uncharacterized protein LOC121937181 [Sceloporus undulatus]XP_042336075.1 uncharacterized protein LOC121937181 [Sceloporus undulatus]XP_042336076.1 uncharacterized protein LOC121937181 [Sceloporus undulatus]
MMPTDLGHQESFPLPRIVWSDLVLRVPHSKAGSKVATKGAERRSDRKLPPASKVPVEDGSCSLGGMDGDMKPSWAYLEGIQEEEREEKWASGPPRSPPENPPSSSPEKQAVKTILVDLRPILEKVTESPDLGKEDSLEDSPKEGSISSQICEYHGEDLIDNRGELGYGRGHQAGDAAMAVLKDEGVHKDLFLPPLRPCSLDLEGIKTPKESQSWRKEPTKISKDSLPALVTLQPKLSAPLFLPKMVPKEHSLVETDIAAQPPAAPSPDFQLPTRMLLWKLQQTTTSDNHLLIARVLSSIREELLADGGEKERRCLELPQIQPFKVERREREPDARKKRLHKFPKKHNRSFQGE